MLVSTCRFQENPSAYSERGINMELSNFRRTKLSGQNVAYRWSQYNIPSSSGEANDNLLYNTASGRLIALRRPLQEIMSHYTEPQVLREEDHALAELGFLVPDYQDEAALARYEVGRSESRKQHLMVLPTERCNFRCIYCYEDYSKGKMRPEIQTGLTTWIANNAHQWDEVSVSWFGGEPLLAYDVVRSLSKEMLTIFKDAGISYRAHMTTNGYLLTTEWAKNLYSLGIDRYQITLDGVADVHDSKRPLAGGKGTYKKIMDNLIALKYSDLEIAVTIRINFDHDNEGNIEEHLGELARQFAGDKRFAIRFFPIGQWGGSNDDSLQPIETASAVKAILQHAHSAAELGLRSSVRELFGPVCYAARANSMIVGADGSLYKCSVAFDNPVNQIGKLRRDGTLEIDDAKLAMWVEGGRADPTCLQCQLFPRCQGSSCPLVRIEGSQRPCPPAMGDFRSYVTELAKEARR